MFTTKQSTSQVHGHSTHIQLHNYADRVLVLVTQLGKAGNLIQASLPDTIPLLPPPPSDSATPNARPLPPPPPAIQLTNLLGRPPSDHLHTLHNLYAAQVATIVWTAEAQGGLESRRRSVIVGVALHNSEGTENERAVFNGVMEMLQDLLSTSK